MNWLEVSLTVSGEAAEAVADVLARYAPNGVVTEATQFEVLSDDKGHAIGPVIVRAYLPADDALETTRAKLEEALWHLGRILPLPEPHYHPIADADWIAQSQASFKPVRVGKHLLVTPPWHNPPLQPAEVRIVLDPGMAFGTGTHPTTQLCLAAIEKHLRPGTPVIDLGTGSGILAIAAAKLGAGPILAVDVDDEAVRVARENIAINTVAAQIQVEQGSVTEILGGRWGVTSAPFVVANILARIIVDLLGQGLDQVVTPGGLLIVSGVLESQAFEVNAALKMHGLTLLAQEHIEDWVAIVARR